VRDRALGDAHAFSYRHRDSVADADVLAKPYAIPVRRRGPKCDLHSIADPHAIDDRERNPHLKPISGLVPEQHAEQFAAKLAEHPANCVRYPHDERNSIADPDDEPDDDYHASNTKRILGNAKPT